MLHVCYFYMADGLFHRMMLRTVKWSQEQCDDVEPILKYGMVKFYADHCHVCVLEMAPAKDARVKVSVVDKRLNLK